MIINLKLYDCLDNEIEYLAFGLLWPFWLMYCLIVGIVKLCRQVACLVYSILLKIEDKYYERDN